MRVEILTTANRMYSWDKNIHFCEELKDLVVPGIWMATVVISLLTRYLKHDSLKSETIPNVSK